MIGAPSANSYIISVFADLRKLYPTWEGMRDFLTSEAGGSLNISEVDGMTIITYKKVVDKKVTFPSEDAFERYPHLEWFQRVIWSTEANLPVAVLPRRCQVFSDKGSLAEVRKHYSIIPYSEGIIKAGFNISETDNIFMPEADITWPDLPNINDPRRYFSGFMNYLISGPGKAIISEPKVASATGLQKGNVYIDGTVEVDDIPLKEVEFDEFVDQGAEFDVAFNNFMAQQDLLYPGWVLVERATGRRYVKMGRFYEEARDYKKISRVGKYRLLEMRRRGDISQYLNIFPGEVGLYDELKPKIYSITTELLDFYLSRWQTKTKGWADIPKQYHKHIAALNNIYHTELKQKRWVMRLPIVIKYINELPAAQLLFLVNRFGQTQAAVEKSEGQVGDECCSEASFTGAANCEEEDSKDTEIDEGDSSD